MEIYRSRRALVALLLPTFVLMAAGQDFDKARQMIEAAKPNIEYATFCAERPSGVDKVSCRIKDVPSVGFLVCKTPEVGEGEDIEPCKDAIANELSSILKVHAANVKTVTVSPEAIDGVKCGIDPSLKCSGFLEGWVDKKDGEALHVRNHISEGTVDELIKTVIQLTKSGLAATAADLTNIVKYMEEEPAEEKYRQICDLQGFFLVDGGFLVADTPSIGEGMTIDQRCWDGEPTTKQVLDALNAMIKAFSQLKGPNVAVIPLSRRGLL